MEMTSMERGIFERYYEAFRQFGFPPPSAIEVTSRTQSTAGRFTHIVHPGHLTFEEGELGLGTISALELDNLAYGASFWIVVESSVAKYLEIVVNGESLWDGSEKGWVIVDPETGEVRR